VSGDRTLAPFGRRRLEVVARRALGAYIVLSVADPEGPDLDPGQFAMLAAAQRWGGGADERPFLPRAFSVARRHGDGTLTHLASGKKIPADTVLFANGRQGATDSLELEAAGLSADKRGKIQADDWGRTAVKHIYAVGDVAKGSPGLAATAFEQGRQAGLVASGHDGHLMPELIPTGVYAIPEIGMVGRTEESLTEASVPYVTGVARWSELARGLISGDEDGMLKLVVATEDRSLLGVHIIGTGAADLVHVGQALLGRPQGVDFLVNAVFNYPTFAESYKVAALDALNNMQILGLLEPGEEGEAATAPDGTAKRNGNVGKKAAPAASK